MINTCYFLIRDIKMHLKNDVNYQKFVFDVIPRVLRITRCESQKRYYKILFIKIIKY